MASKSSQKTTSSQTSHLSPVAWQEANSKTASPLSYRASHQTQGQLPKAPQSSQLTLAQGLLKSTEITGFSAGTLEAFREWVLAEGRRLYRNLPWRTTRNPYAVLVSEIMLQQTQVSRVQGRWERWLERFPNIAVLAEASRAEVLQEWQGLGYNRRALALQKAAITLSKTKVFPKEVKELQKLPGIGPATAAGVRAFAFNLPCVYLETNVRTVFLHELFPTAQHVKDRELVPYVEATCPKNATDPQDDPRTWYYALLDVGAELKRAGSKAHRRSTATTRQGRFEGSRRQKRAELVRLLLGAQETESKRLSTGELTALLGDVEEAQGRSRPSFGTVESLLQELAQEGFCQQENKRWWC